MAAGPEHKLQEHNMIYTPKPSAVLPSQLQSCRRTETGPSVTFSSLSGTAYRSYTKSLCIFVCAQGNANHFEMSAVMFVSELL